MLFGVFCSGKRDLSWLGEAKWVLLSILILLVMASGCRRKQKPVPTPELEQVVTNRANDKVYMEGLLDNHREQNKSMAAVAAISIQMTSMVQRVAATLPEGFEQEALDRVLADSKEWQQLVEAEKSARAEAEKVYESGKAMIRQRMLKESDDIEAVKEGRARPIDADRQG